MMIWCEHCRDHYQPYHYADSGNHLVGIEYGPAGTDLAIRAAAQSVRDSKLLVDAGVDEAHLEHSLEVLCELLEKAHL